MIYHGGNLLRASREFSIPVSDWIDLSTGINPHAYPFKKMASHSWERLPDHKAVFDLIETARIAYSVPSVFSVQPIAGTQAILNLLPLVLPQKGAVRILGPTYKEHLNAWQLNREDVKECHHLEELGTHANIAVIVNPDNPTGRVIETRKLCQIAKDLANRGGFLIIDAAFSDCDPNIDYGPLYDFSNVVILRSFGKFFGLAGIRLGVVMANPEIIAKLNQYLGAWSVSGPALAIGHQALSDVQWQKEMQIRLKREVEKLDKVLIEGGLDVQGGTTLFRFCKSKNSVELYKKLGKKGILIRPFDDFPHHVRIGLPANQDQLNHLKSSL